MSGFRKPVSKRFASEGNLARAKEIKEVEGCLSASSSMQNLCPPEVAKAYGPYSVEVTMTIFKEGFALLDYPLPSKPSMAFIQKLLFANSSKRKNLLLKVAAKIIGEEKQYSNPDLLKILTGFVFIPHSVQDAFVEGTLTNKDEQTKIWVAIFTNLKAQQFSGGNLSVNDCLDYLKSASLGEKPSLEVAEQLCRPHPNAENKREEDDSSSSSEEDDIEEFLKEIENEDYLNDDPFTNEPNAASSAATLEKVTEIMENIAKEIRKL